MAELDPGKPFPEIREIQPGSLMRNNLGAISETTGRLGRMGSQWFIEIENEGAKAWWDIEFVTPAYERGRDG